MRDHAQVEQEEIAVALGLARKRGHADVAEALSPAGGTWFDNDGVLEEAN